MRTVLSPLALLLVALSTTGCPSTVEEAGRDCPCAPGWTCCEGTCVKGGPAVCGPPRDLAAPDAPQLLAATPGSPTAQPRVTLYGRAEPAARVQLFGRPDCTGPALAEVEADAAGALAFDVALAPDTTNLFWARATDAASNTSQCSAPGLAVVHDTLPPAVPLLEALAPSALSRTTTRPHVSGRTEPNAQVAVFVDAACAGLEVGTGLADAAGAFSIEVQAGSNTVTTFWARATDAAGNVSACGQASPPFVHDSVPPEPPGAASLSVPSPSRETRVTWTGTAEPRARLHLFSAAYCAGAPIGALEADAAGAWSFQLDAMDNATTARWATATDAAGNTSACAHLGAYVHDTRPPPSLRNSHLASGTPSNRRDVIFAGQAPEAVRVSTATTSTCEPELGSAQVGADAAFAVPFTVPGTAEGTTGIWARSFDAAGNASQCALYSAFTYDVTAPAPPRLVALSEPSPAEWSGWSGHLLGTAEPHAALRIHHSTDCSGPHEVEAQARAERLPGDGWGNFSALVGLSPEREAVFSAVAVDAAGNASACSTPVRRELASSGLRWRPPTDEATSTDAIAALRLDGRGGLWMLRYVNVVESQTLRLEVLRRDASEGEDAGWGAPHVLSSSGAWWMPELHVDAHGNLLAVWEDTSRSDAGEYTSVVRAARYDATSSTWGAPDTLTEPLSSLSLAAAALGPEGQAVACWVRYAVANTLTCRFAPAGAGWEAPVQVGTRVGHGAVVALAGPGGGARVLWTEIASDSDPAPDLLESVHGPAGAWSPGALLTDDGRAWAAHVDATGAAWMSWLSLSLSGAPTFHVRRAPTADAPWGPTERPLPEGLGALDGGVVGDGFLVYRTGAVDGGNAPGTRVWLTHRGPGGWSAPVEVRAREEGLWRVTAQPGAPGEVWLQWHAELGGTPYAAAAPTVLVRRYTLAGGLEPAQGLFHETQPNVYLDPVSHVATDAAGRVAVVWERTWYDEAAGGWQQQSRLRVLR